MYKSFWNIVMLLFVVIGSLLPITNPLAAVEPTPPRLSQITAHPLLQTRKTQVLDVSLDGEAILINLSRAILPDGTYNADTFAQLTHALDVELQLSDSYFVTLLAA